MRYVGLFTVVAALALAGTQAGAAPAGHSGVPAFERFHAPGAPSWAGVDIVHEVGCAAYHVSEVSRPPFPDLGRKYTLESLTTFLRGPLAHWPDGRMPDLGLGLQEASDIASYLLGRQRVKTDDVTP